MEDKHLFSSTIYGLVIKRDLLDSSIIIVTESPRIETYINLALWLIVEPQRQLPYENKTIKIEHLKLVTPRDLDNVEHYLANSQTELSYLSDYIIANETAHIPSVYDVFDCSHEVDLLQIIRNNNLTWKHVETYMKLTRIFPSLGTQYGNIYHLLIFKTIAELHLFKIVQEKDNDEFMVELPLIYTASTLCRIDKAVQGRQWEGNIPEVYFGNKPSRDECLIGIFTSRLGKLCIDAGGESIIIHTSLPPDQHSQLLKFHNCFVFIRKFHIISEIYPNASIETAFVHFEDITVLTKTISVILPMENYKESRIVATLDEVPFSKERHYEYTFEIEAIGPVSCRLQQDVLETWLHINLHVLVGNNVHKRGCFLSLDSNFEASTAFLDMGRTYTLYTTDAMNDVNGQREMANINKYIPCKQLKSANFYFMPHDNFEAISVTNVLRYDKPGVLNIKAIVKTHRLNTRMASRSQGLYKSSLVGLPVAELDHHLSCSLNGTFSFYLNNWEMKLPPEGLHPNVVILITHVKFTGNYLKSDALTNINIIGVCDELQTYVTANLNPQRKPRMVDYDTLSIPPLYSMFVRSRVFIEYFECSLDYLGCTFECSFVAIDDKGRKRVRGEEFALLFKILSLMANDVMKQFFTIGSFDAIEWNNLIEDETKMAFLDSRLEDCAQILNKGKVSVDMLCDKTGDNIWLLDIYQINL